MDYCDICGEVGVADDLLTCTRCKINHEHTYCMKTPAEEHIDDWRCEECESSFKTKPPAFSTNRKLKGGHDDVQNDKADVTPAASQEGDENSMEIDSSDTQARVSTRDRTYIRLDSRGQAVGKEVAKMQSYIGILARRKVKISYKTWRHVPEDVKELIWESVNLKYNVDPEWKKACLSSASAKWRQYKTTLTKHFVWKYKDQPEKLKKPPTGYGISQEDWSSFVTSRMSESFSKLSEEQKERGKANIYPHRPTRKGYARLAEDIGSELCDDDEINRAILRKKGRANTKGEIEGDDLKETVAKIDDYIEQKKEGKLKIKGAKEDIVTKALEKQERSGRVRGLGEHDTPSMYFNVAIGKKQVDQGVISEQRKELMEVEKLIAEHGALIKEQDALIKEQCARIKEQNVRLEKLESIFIKKQDIDNEEKASRSVKHQYQSNKDGMGAANNYLNAEEIGVADFLIRNKKGSAAASTLDSKHGMDESTHLPVKIPRMCDSRGDVVRNHVAWPAHVIKLQNEKPSTKKVGDGKNKTKVVNSNMTRELYMFYCCCKNVLHDGKSISMTLDDDVFGIEKVIHVNLSDITHLCELEPVSYYCIIVYIWHLYKKMKEEFVSDFLFVDPYHIGHVPTTRTDKSYLQQLMESRARFLADRLSSASINQVVLAPCNIGYHWILTVIDPYKETVHVLDPLGTRIRDDTWRDVVNLALKLFNAEKGRKGKKKPKWEVIRAPIQPDEKQCGFYVMRYMREILHEYIKTNKARLRTIFKKGEYSRAQIDEVRAEWAQCIQDYIFE